jgi:hypothetical protein
VVVLPSPAHVGATDGLRLWGQRVIAKAVGEVIGLVAVAGGGLSRTVFLYTAASCCADRPSCGSGYGIPGRALRPGGAESGSLRPYLPRVPGLIFEALSMSCGGNVDAYQKGHRHAQQAYSRSHGF